jgi:ribosomal protein S21
MEIRKRENETASSLIYRFTKRTQQSGILREVKKRRFESRPVSRLKRKLSAIHRAEKRKEFTRAKKLGIA